MATANGYCYHASPELAQAKELTPWYGAVDHSGYAIPGTQPPAPWHGKTVACIGSGPSLLEEDCALVKAAGLPTVTTNDTFKIAPFTDVILAVDLGWWQQHIHEVRPGPECWTTSASAAKEFDLHFFITYTGAGGSGARAVELAIVRGAKRVILLGYDCSLEHGLHWHGPHTRTGNPDEGTVQNWHKQFGELADIAKRSGVDVVNCSRRTALTHFRRSDLRKTLDSSKKMESANHT